MASCPVEGAILDAQGLPLNPLGSLTGIPPEIERVIVLKAGKIVADGGKADVLTNAVLSDAYDTPIHVVEVEGHFLAYPGNGSRKT